VTKPIEVHKFGGTSVADAGRIARAAELVERAAGSARPCVVSSAMSGVTNALLAMATGDAGDPTDAITELYTRHETALGELRLPAGDAEEVECCFEEIEQLAKLAWFLAPFGGPPPAVRDRLISMGERLAVRLLAGALRQRGLRTEAIDADAFLPTGPAFGEAEPLSYTGDEETKSALHPRLDAGVIPVVTGFMGRGPDGLTRLLGRGGSDFSAALLAASLEAAKLVIWTDVEGVWTADPRLVPEARPIAHLTYREAGEMAFFGSKVLHPRTTIPVARRGIPTAVRSTFTPEGRETRIDTAAARGVIGPAGVSTMRDVSLISLEGGGIAGVAGVSARLFEALAHGEVSVVMISQGSSECSICVGVRERDADRGEAALQAAFAGDIERGMVERIVCHRAIGIVTAVGSGMKHRVGAMSLMSTAIARSGTNILAIAQGSSELSVSFAVERDDLSRAARALHATLDDGPAPLSIALVGLGNVGRAVAERIAASATDRLIAIADSSGFVFDNSGIDPQLVRALARAKAEGVALAESPNSAREPLEGLIQSIKERGIINPVLVDCTASPGMVGVARHALDAGMDVVTANKEILACAADEYTRLRDAAMHAGTLLRGEATVGAGLPVERTIEILRTSGDVIEMIDAQISGTIAFLLGRIADGMPLRNSLADAIDRAFAEPDPRSDLHGLDLQRKACILARSAGFGEVPIETEPFCKLPGSDPEAPDAQRALERASEEIARRIAHAGEHGRVLAYSARITPGGARVGFVEREPTDPLANMPGAQAGVLVQSTHGGGEPLVIRGTGAGAVPTAGGVLADLAIIRDRRSLVRPRKERAL